ncbi:hypothetical protein ACF1CG_27165 [Streptomyces sp. NPDC014773]|uniref:hypothetical protein n=1 Tax=Streptomyces sp. NPDC014773 TaxID=3364908 RepID=UPI0036FDD1E1
MGGRAAGGAGVLGRVRVPVRVRCAFAGHEAWWRHGPEGVAGPTGRPALAPRVPLDRPAGAGHPVGPGRAARAYRLRVFAFPEERPAAGGGRAVPVP